MSQSIFAQLPDHLIAKVLSHCKLSSVVGDDIMDFFIIQHCVNIQPETIFQAFVKKRRGRGLQLFFQKYHECTLSVATVQHAMRDLLKHNELRLAQYLCSMCSLRVHQIKSYVLRTCMQQLTKYNDQHRRQQWYDFMEHFVACLGNDYQHNDIIPWRILHSIMQSPHSNDIVAFLHSHRLLAGSLRYLTSGDDSDDNIEAVVRTTIQKNMVFFMSLLISGGYQVNLANIIQGVVCSDISMNRVLLKFFRPRFYSAKFAAYLIDICQMRKEESLRQLLSSKL